MRIRAVVVSVTGEETAPVLRAERTARVLPAPPTTAMNLRAFPLTGEAARAGGVDLPLSPAQRTRLAEEGAGSVLWGFRPEPVGLVSDTDGFPMELGQVVHLRVRPGQVHVFFPVTGEHLQGRASSGVGSGTFPLPLSLASINLSQRNSM